MIKLNLNKGLEKSSNKTVLLKKTYHSVWKQSSVLVIPILTRKFLTKSSTISGLW